MKIAYVVAENLSKEHGVSKKIYNQIKFWTESKHEVKLFYFSNKPLNSMFKEIEHTVINYKSRINFVLGNKSIIPIEDWQPDIIYFRSYLFTNTFNTMAKKFPTIMEINSDDEQQNKIHMPYFARYFDKLTRKKLIKNAAGFVCVTKELEKNILYIIFQLLLFLME
ncbi:hypothetical protein ACFFIX_12655 [Metabacillus herbersteinensis]|uniref:Glycosyltransferase subfamily 4-like N-terminal domain-containing protein n=1 Tax=Metabacillus herbersteinensis TaxID=283816 RepID=A0ABV6GFW0_9BACI